ncbi:unnamed protein product [Sphenostylis stenocarpa]|uniref:Uncharacterized protein n=1 Tax=Sphenostylis stenocarpa TaxID=92480 RepID=A0AA86W0Q8_9FABA|nr:unnamed protein product [Sphenostylis stenocarpa]
MCAYWSRLITLFPPPVARVKLDDDDADDDISMLELVLAIDVPLCDSKQEWLWGSSSASWTINLSMRLAFKARDNTKKCLEEKKVGSLAIQKERVCVLGGGGRRSSFLVLQVPLL